jgi:hypothetical protein
LLVPESVAYFPWFYIEYDLQGGGREMQLHSHVQCLGFSHYLGLFIDITKV